MIEAELRDSPRIFTHKRSQDIIPGYPLESLQIDPQSGRYIADMSTHEQAEFWQRTTGLPLGNFVQSMHT